MVEPAVAQPQVAHTLEVQTLHSMERVPRRLWDEVAQHHFYMSSGWLRCIEACKAGTAPLRIFLAWEHERLLGIAAGVLHGGAGSNRALDQVLLGKLAQPLNRLGFSFGPALLLAPLEGRGEDFVLLAPALSEPRQREVLNCMLDAIEAEARKQRASASFSEVPPHSTPLLQVLRERGYCQTLSFPISVLPIRWPSLQEYKLDKRAISKKMRSNITQQMKRNSREGVEIFALDDDAQLARYGQAIEQVIMRHYTNYNDVFPFRAGFLEKFWRELGRDLTVYVAIKNEELVAASLIYSGGDTRHCKLIGVDHQKTGNDFTYFNIVYFRPMADAMTEGCHELTYGVSNYSLKSRLGCVMQHNLVLYKSRRRFLAPLIALWFKIHRHWFAKKFQLDRLKKDMR